MPDWLADGEDEGRLAASMTLRGVVAYPDLKRPKKLNATVFLRFRPVGALAGPQHCQKRVLAQSSAPPKRIGRPPSNCLAQIARAPWCRAKSQTPPPRFKSRKRQQDGMGGSHELPPKAEVEVRPPSFTVVSHCSAPQGQRGGTVSAPEPALPAPAGIGEMPPSCRSSRFAS